MKHFTENIQIPFTNNAIDDRQITNEQKEINDKQEYLLDKESTVINKQIKSPLGIGENSLRHSPNGKNKRLLTRDIMSGEFFTSKDRNNYPKY
jgi:hypothetical protein